MALSESIAGSHAAASPSGELLACISDKKLRLYQTTAPGSCAEFSLRIPAKDISSIKWAECSAKVAVCSSQCIEVVDLDDPGHRIKLDNGSGGLGQIASADFIGVEHLLVTWEFGRAKLWNVETGKSFELDDLKTTNNGPSWALRPRNQHAAPTLALLSRKDAVDYLTLHVPASEKSMPAVRYGSVDSQAVLWSPDGRWLAIEETTWAEPHIAFFTPDGHRFRDYPWKNLYTDDCNYDHAVKEILWSPDSSTLAVSRYDSSIVLLNSRTFAPRALIEHSTTIDQRHATNNERALVWQEVVSPSNVRSYTLASQTVSPPRSSDKVQGKGDFGVTEMKYSCDGRYLATCDRRMLSTVWIWEVATDFDAIAVVIQHSNVRRLHWHPTRPDILMFDCGESIVYLLDLSTSEPPIPFMIAMPATPTFSWIHTPAESKPVILASTKSTFCLLYPEGRVEQADAGAIDTGDVNESLPFIEGRSEDSLLEALTGRKSTRQETQPSYTEVVEMEADGEATVGLDDTFREKRRPRHAEMEVDPLDDSDIF